MDEKTIKSISELRDPTYKSKFREHMKALRCYVSNIWSELYNAEHDARIAEDSIDDNMKFDLEECNEQLRLIQKRVHNLKGMVEAARFDIINMKDDIILHQNDTKYK